MQLTIAILILSHGGQLNTRLTYAQEAAIILEVAREYELTEGQTVLLVCIRRVENGPAGTEFGAHSEEPAHPAHRYRDNPEKSLELQAMYAAGTIKRHPESLEKFARRWCPVNAKNWQRMVENYLRLGSDV